MAVGNPNPEATRSVASGTTEPMHIALSADDAYVAHAATLIRSLLASNPGETMVLHLLHDDGLSPENRRRLSEWATQRRADLRLHAVQPETCTGFSDRKFHRSVWFRILLPDLLPSERKVLYLDADTLVLERLRPLWDTDLRGALFGAVVGVVYPFMRDWVLNRPGLPPASRYLNSGVLLLDLDHMRAEDCVEQLREHSRQHPDDAFPEQDALSVLYHDRYLLLHPRWNAQTPFFDVPASELPCPPEQVAEARADPAVIHFIGPHKPSHYLCRNPYQGAYLAARQDTPWPLAMPKAGHPADYILRRLPVEWEVRYARLKNFLRPSRKSQ